MNWNGAVIDGVTGFDGETEEAQQSSVTVRVGRHKDVPQAPFPMCFTRRALRDLLESVGQRPPESGAKGFGPVDRIGFDRIEFDEQGSSAAGGAVYSPDVDWGQERCVHHLNLGEPETRVWTGDLHSHPGGYGSPSPAAGKGLGDLGYVKEVFEQNETMEWFFIPILTGTGRGAREVVVHPWVVRRDGTVFIADMKVCEASEFPAREYNPEWAGRNEAAPALAEAAARAEAAGVGRPEPVETAHGASIRAGGLSLAEERRAVGGRIEERATGSSAPSGAAAGVGGEGATSAGKSGGGAGSAGARARERIRGLYTSRLRGVVSPAFHSRSIGVVGVGAGSYMVEKLGRLCPRRIKVCDFDAVEVPNLVRTCYAFSDAVVGRKKVVAMARRLEEVCPLVKVTGFAQSITAMGDDALDEFFEGLDLVVAGTDHFPAQALLNEEAVRRGIPAVFIGIHAGAQGGRVIWTLPGVTPCYRCVAKERFEAVEQNRAVPDLAAALGSIVDCQFIDMAALKMVLAILERGQNSAMGRFFQRVGTRNDIIIRCDPAYEWGNLMWDAVLADLPESPKAFAKELKEAALFAMDSLWLRGEFDPDCPVCGGGSEPGPGRGAR